MFTEKEKAFLMDLEDISRKHGIIIEGCGCCGSPGLALMEHHGPDCGYGTDGKREIVWLHPEFFKEDFPKTKWEKYKNTIVKRG